MDPSQNSFVPVEKSKSTRIKHCFLKKGAEGKKDYKKKKTVSVIMSQIEEEKESHTVEEKEMIKKKSQAIYKYDDKIDDIYLKNLNKVNKIKESDDFIVTVLKALELPKISKQKFMKLRSCNVVPGGSNLHLTAVDSIVKNQKVFDEGLDEESKITLENTILNKFQKQVSDVSKDKN